MYSRHLSCVEEILCGCIAQSVSVSTFGNLFPEILEINMIKVQLLHLQKCCQNFPWRSKAYMWQCHNQYINSCTRAGWCNPDLWLRLATHGIGNTHILTDMLHPTGTIRIQLCSFSPSLPPNVSIKALLAAHAGGWRTPADFSLGLQLLGVRSAELSSSGKRDRECCFQ